MSVSINGFSFPASLFTAYMVFSIIVSVTVALYFTRGRTWQARLACTFLAVMLSFSMLWNWVYLAALSIFAMRDGQYNKKGSVVG
ncbi:MULTISPECIES: hypothetical protein [Microbulbifer]|uniref:hypothetical protein n=1 Tax=Microbulbifer TaxID=48073 RepID=UPI001E608F50|nr:MULTISPECIES: hypothetical protein [Microbulbifer]UHQ56493.1 hypothetical protein LVE68_05830 [Microbulbifer sp. YPW16]